MTSPCPNADTLVALAEGRIPANESRALSEHVAECSLCGLLVADLDAPSSTSAPTVDAVVEELSDAAIGLPLDPGEMAGRYRILRVVGQGAMGVVYEAEDPRLDRRIAVKALKVSPTDAAAGSMLLEEGQSLGQLQHPHVVPVFDVGTCRMGWFIAMEFVDGQALDAWCEPQPWTAIVDRFAEAAEGLAAAHQVGIVHRDFKPSNVLVGADNRARVADFGIAVASSGASPSHTLEGSSSGPRPVRASATGAMIGTPVYMAPEQLSGEPASPRSDQFAFFVSLFEMLEGKRPFAGSTPDALLRARVAGPAPMQRTDLPVELRDLIATGLSFEPEQRHRSMLDVAAALRAIRLPKPNRWPWVIGGGLVLAAAAAFATATQPSHRCESTATAFESTWQGEQRPALRTRWEGVLPAETFNRIDQRLERFARGWATEFSSACGDAAELGAPIHACLRRRSTLFDAALEVSAQEETSASKLMDVLIEATPGLSCSESNPQGAARSSFARADVIDGWNARARALYAADRFAASHALLAPRWEVIERLGTREQRADALFFLATTELFSNDASDGFARLTDAHALATAAGSNELAASISLAALQWAPLVDPEAAEAWTRRARADVERAGSPQLSGRFYVALGSREQQRGHLQSAMEAATAAEAFIDEGNLDNDLPWMLASLRGHIEQGRHNYDAALVHFESGLELLERLRGPGTMLSIRLNSGLIQALLGAGDVELAAVVMQDQEALLDTPELRAPQRSTSSMLRARYYNAVGDLESAVLEARAQAELLSPTDIQWSGVHTRLGLALLRTHDYAAARDVFERIRVHQEDRLGASAKLAITVHNLAEADSGMGELDRAAKHYRQALSIAAAGDAQSPVEAYSLTGLAEVELQQGELELAREHLTRALEISHGDEAERAEARFSLARTLWKIGGPANRVHALELSDQAAATLDDSPGYEQSALELSRWRETL